jgi:hypothetical protein
MFELIPDFCFVLVYLKWELVEERRIRMMWPWTLCIRSIGRWKVLWGRFIATWVYICERQVEIFIALLTNIPVLFSLALKILPKEPHAKGSSRMSVISLARIFMLRNDDLKTTRQLNNPIEKANASKRRTIKTAINERRDDWPAECEVWDKWMGQSWTGKRVDSAGGSNILMHKRYLGTRAAVPRPFEVR